MKYLRSIEKKTKDKYKNTLKKLTHGLYEQFNTCPRKNNLNLFKIVNFGQDEMLSIKKILDRKNE